MSPNADLEVLTCGTHTARPVSRTPTALEVRLCCTNDGFMPDDTERLRRWAAGDDPLALRASIVLLALDGVRSSDISRRLGVSPQTVGNRREPHPAHGADGLRDRPHPGRPRTVDEADIVVRALLAPTDRRSARALARECGVSHALVADIRQRWHLTSDRASVPVIPAQPALPDGEIWVLGLYHDGRGTVMLLGSRPQRSTALIAAAIDPGTLDVVDAALTVASERE